MDLTDAIQWAGQATIDETRANHTVQAGLQSLLNMRSKVNITNPVSSPRDGTTPDLTRVLLCESERHQLCIKFYPNSNEGIAALQKHAMLLSQLKPTISVPDVIEVSLEEDQFGFPALVTTASGKPLDQQLQGQSVAYQKKRVVDIARELATLHKIPMDGLPITVEYNPDYVFKTWQQDAEWYIENAGKAGKAGDLVCRAASALSNYREAPSRGCLIHRDPTPHNVLVKDAAVTLIDWDHADLQPAQEDVAKTLISILGMLTLPRSARIPLARIFINTYSQINSLSSEELYQQSLPFALDTILDWLLGGKNAPREELSWATQQIMIAAP